jgi:LPS export ABC transporter protein LptC/lipopolysaccharide transport protein LptA
VILLLGLANGSEERRVLYANHQMRLERIFRHRIIRLLRLVLPILVLALIAIPAWNFYARRVQRNDSPRSGVKLPSGVSVRTEGFNYERSEGGRPQFTVRARQSLGYKDEKYILQDVDVTIYGTTDQDFDRQVHGDNCSYDEATNDFTCNGNVKMQLEEKTFVHTENVIYNHRDGIVTGPHRATIDKDGTVGHADSFEYGLNTGLLKLTGNVRIQTDNRIEIETGAAVFHQKESWTTMSGGVFVKSPAGWIRGSSGRATLQAGTYKPKLITIEDSVTAESQAQTAAEMWKVRSGWIEASISDTGNPQRVRTRGNVEIQKVAGGSTQSLTGDEMDAELKEGRVESLEARGNARMAFGADQSLGAAEIWTNSMGLVKTSNNSVLKVGDSTIEGREFVIENGERIVTFTTLRRASMKKEGGLESSSDETRARFERRTSMLLELVQKGNFEFRTPQYAGRAQSGRFEEGGSIVILEGSSLVSDPEKRLEASEIRINQKDNSFVATKNVSTVLKSPTDSVLVRAARAEGGAESILYTGSVQLWRGDAYIKAARLNAFGKGGPNTKVRAEGGANGKVQSNLQSMRVTADTLDYDQAGGVVRYLGHVHAQKQDMILDTSDMTVHFRNDNVTEIVASGGVAVTRAQQSGTGEQAVYDAATDVVTLTGKNAQVRDVQRGSAQGSKLTIGKKGQTASVEAESGERTVTKHPVQKKK